MGRLQRRLASWVVFVAMSIAGCAARPASVGTAVRAIRFEGNGGMFAADSDRALRRTLVHPRPTGVWPLRREAPLDRSILEDDRRRVYLHYAHDGWFAADVTWRIEEVRPERDVEPPAVRVVGVVTRGERSLVKDVRWEGLDGISAPLRAAIVDAAALGSGDPFRLADHDATVVAARDLLHEHAYAHARVEGTVEVADDGAVTLDYRVEPGVVATYGPIEVVGGDAVPEKLVRQRLDLERGDAYRRSELSRTQQNLYGMRAFSVVEVRPLLRSEPPEVVPIRIRLEERAPRSLALAAGLQAQSGRQEALGRVRFEHVNVLHRLIDFELEATGGYATLADDGQLFALRGVRGGPVVDATAQFGVPIVRPSRWRAAVEVGFEREVTWAYQLNRPSVTPSISGPIARHWLLSLSYWLRYTQYLDVQVDPAELAALGDAPDLVDGEFVGAWLEQAVIWDTRDDPLQPSRGHRHSLTLREAGTWLGGSFDYLGVLGELREYVSLPRRWPGWTDGIVLAGRLGGGWLAPYGPPERRAVPISERLYLGGSGSVRGWVYQHLGPTVPATDADAAADVVPVGGQVSAYGSAEVRTAWDPVGAVVFVDAGMVWSTPEQVSQVPILPSVGVGGRVQTPVGPFRLDVAVRTDQQAQFASEPRVWFHLGLGEAF